MWSFFIYFEIKERFYLEIMLIYRHNTSNKKENLDNKEAKAYVLVS